MIEACLRRTTRTEAPSLVDDDRASSAASIKLCINLACARGRYGLGCGPGAVATSGHSAKVGGHLDGRFCRWRATSPSARWPRRDFDAQQIDGIPPIALTA
jgi:hypothetical protein